MISVITFMEIIFNFFRASLDPTPEERTIKYVSKNYLQSWFWFDLLANIHMELWVSRYFLVVKLFRIRQVVRSSISLERLIGRTSEVLFNNSLNINLGKIFGKASKLIIFLIVVGHMLSLLVIVIGFDFVFSIYENSTEKQPRFEVYISTMHFVTTTITTVGYGENSINSAVP